LEAFAGSFSAWTLQSIETLVSSGAKIQIFDNKLNTPPLIAAQNGNKRLVEYFLSKGGNLKIKDDADKNSNDASGGVTKPPSHPTVRIFLPSGEIYEPMAEQKCLGKLLTPLALEYNLPDFSKL
jgi:hypothetical protein